MTTILIIIAAVISLLIIVVFAIGGLRNKGKRYNKYESFSDKFDSTLKEKTIKIEKRFDRILKLLNFNVKHFFVCVLKYLLDLLHIVTRKISISISKLRNKYHKKTATSDIPSSPSEFLKEVGNRDDK